MSYIKWPVIIAIALFPALSIVLHNAGNACLYLLFVCSIVALVCRYKPMETSFGQLLKQYWPLHLAMASLFCAVFLNQIVSGDFAVKQYDRAVRLAVFAPIFWIILSVPLRHLKNVQWAFVVGVFAAVIKTYVITEGGIDRFGNVGFLSTIAFSNIALLLGAMALISFGWNERRQKVIFVVKVLACCVGLYATLLAKTRGSWIAIPFFFAFMFMFFGNIRIRHKLAIAVLSLAVLAGIFTFSSAVQTRLAETKSEISLFVSGQNVDTSTGIRLQLWHASWILFKQHPVVGIGRENFSSGLNELVSRKVITPAAASLAHSHNEILFNTTILGIFGFLASVSIYCVPAYYFMRDIRDADDDIRTAAGLGLLLCLGFFIYGLTDLMFFWTVLGGFYSMSVATFLACIIKRKKELKRTDP
ncbi:O-antigen ligase family protein [Paraherbaspirillum soli]|uniref:O-antigen ligase family protein n=1 Tax=Paraherbaspirillum soli TaxID=631222 RepID=A0ABW0MDF6_9BURK